MIYHVEVRARRQTLEYGEARRFRGNVLRSILDIWYNLMIYKIEWWDYRPTIAL